MRRTFALLALVAVTAIGLCVAACGFPDPILADVNGSSLLPDGAVQTAQDGGADSTTSADAAPDAVDVTCKKPCDCDDDGEPSKEPGCGGNDCDDRDPARHPGVAFSTTPPVDGGTWDYDCNGTEDKPSTNFQCGARGVSECAGKGGYKSDPGCGEPAVFVKCRVAVGGNTCQEDTLDTSGVMPCR